MGDRKCGFDGCDALEFRISGYCLRHKVEQLIKIPRSLDDDVILQEAIEALGDIGDERAVEPLIEFINGVQINRQNSWMNIPFLINESMFGVLHVLLFP